MIDAYLWGKVDRISPEAPVPIVSVTKRENRLGGAANVAINIQSLGATPILCSVIGNDLNGRTFIELLQQMNMTADGLVQSPERPTTKKTRVIGNNYQMLRVDEERDEDINSADRKRLLSRISNLIAKENVDVIVIEDYDKGVVSKSLIEQVVKIARQYKIPIAVDPKKRNFNHYKNITLFKPNLKELREGMKLDLEKGNIKDIISAVQKIRKDHQLDTVLLTLSERGILLVDDKHEQLLPAHIRNIADVSGAGDTVISVAALCLALKTDAVQLATLSNLAGGLVCEKVGVVPVEREQLLAEAKILRIADK
ncbi:MAG: D-glycero-beta-D-manno-heptose-7-phosphate kinase [Bacteroidia bacterium]|nr:D-glycero-beta-D-manno-heptose-7-phosphate kinase [Bacteroidia bacterium]